MKRGVRTAGLQTRLMHSAESFLSHLFATPKKLPGLSFFYGGLVRDTSIINTMMMTLGERGRQRAALTRTQGCLPRQRDVQCFFFCEGGPQSKHQDPERCVWVCVCVSNTVGTRVKVDPIQACRFPSGLP